MNINEFIMAERQSAWHQLEKSRAELHRQEAQIRLDFEASFPVKYLIVVHGTTRWTDMPSKEEIGNREINLEQPILRACRKFWSHCLTRLRIEAKDVVVYAILESGTEIPIPKMYWEKFL